MRTLGNGGEGASENMLHCFPFLTINVLHKPQSSGPDFQPRVLSQATFSSVSFWSITLLISFPLYCIYFPEHSNSLVLKSQLNYPWKPHMFIDIAYSPLMN